MSEFNHIDKTEIQARYFEIIKDLRRLCLNHQPATLVAVSKTQPIEAIEALYALGHRDFAENYAQELLEKNELLRARGIRDIRWHFIGPLQSNKVKSLVGIAKVFHAIDRLKIVEEIVRQLQSRERMTRIPVFVQVNIDLEPSKSGVLPDAAESLIDACRDFSEIQIQGLMCIPNPHLSSSGSFAKLRDLRDRLGSKTKGSLSMGMSQDYLQAIPQGATHLRLGSAIFGERIPRNTG